MNRVKGKRRKCEGAGGMEGKGRQRGIGVIYRQVSKRGRDEGGKAGKIERLEGFNYRLNME
jgi:hypothetical protein